MRPEFETLSDYLGVIMPHNLQGSLLLWESRHGRCRMISTILRKKNRIIRKFKNDIWYSMAQIPMYKGWGKFNPEIEGKKIALQTKINKLINK